MAESGYKVKAIGAPFDTNYSSCSNLKPTNFNWTLDEGIFHVHIDRGILYQPNFSVSKNKRYGWICESRFIVPDVYNFLIHNHKVLFDNYYNKIFTCDSSLLELNSNFIFSPNGSNYPWIPRPEWEIYNKTKLCSMFCSPKKATEGHVYRHQIARLAIDAELDVFGGAHGTQRTVIDPKNPWNTKLNGVKDYMFSVVIENGIYDSYWTEKITDCFATGTVPVYCGSKKVFDFFDPDGIIILEQNKEQEILQSLSKQLYDSKIIAIKNNFNAVSKIKIADDVIWEKINETVST